MLDNGEVALVDLVNTRRRELTITSPNERPARLIERLASLYAGLGCVDAAHLAEIHLPGDPAQRGLLVVVAVPARAAEHAARATTTALQAHCRSRRMTVDLIFFEPSKAPDWLESAGLEPFYVRASGLQ